ncbi:MAG: response regulator transcription factor [Candidatus Izemoplasmataceae bacterium]
MRNIIVLEDNKDISKILTNILLKEGYNVFPSFNAFDALNDFKNNHIDCILTDLMLPIMSGEEFIQEIRKDSNVHIIIISAKTTSPDKIEGLKKGADDYLFKPFLEEEVIIKLENLFNKKDFKENITTFNKKEIVFQEGKTHIVINNETISLTSVEYQMLRLLIQENNKVITREQFLDMLYTFDDEVFDRVVDVHIRNIRKKIKTIYDKELIKTVYGLGYSFIGEMDE